MQENLSEIQKDEINGDFEDRLRDFEQKREIYDNVRSVMWDQQSNIRRKVVGYLLAISLFEGE